MFKRIGRPPKSPEMQQAEQLKDAVVGSKTMEVRQQEEDAWTLVDVPTQTTVGFKHKSGEVLSLEEAICEILNRTEE